MSRIASQKSRRQKNLTAFSQFATEVASSQDGGGSTETEARKYERKFKSKCSLGTPIIF
jgi:hypothetical protein